MGMTFLCVFKVYIKAAQRKDEAASIITT